MSVPSLYIRVSGKVLGRFSASQSQSLRDRGKCHAFHEVSEDRTAWRPASSLTEMFPLEPTIRPRAAPIFSEQAPPVVTPVTVPQEKWVYVESERRREEHQTRLPAQ